MEPLYSNNLSYYEQYIYANPVQGYNTGFDVIYRNINVNYYVV